MTDEKKPQDGQESGQDQATATLLKSQVDAVAAPKRVSAAAVQAPSPAAATRTIRLKPEDGIISRAGYEAGRDYTIPADKAERLLASGYFEEVR